MPPTEALTFDTLQHVAALVAGALNLAIGLVVIYQEPKRITHRLFCGLCLGLAVWNFGWYYYEIFEDVAFQRLLFLGLLIVPPVGLHFLVEFLPARKVHPNLISILYGASAIGWATTLFPWFHEHNVVWKAGASIYLFPVLFYALVLIYQSYEEARDEPLNRRRLGILFFAVAIASLTGLFEIVLPFFRIYFPELPASFGLSSLANVVYALLIAYAIQRHRLFDLQQAVRALLSRTLVGLSILGLLIIGHTLLTEARNVGEGRDVPFVMFFVISIVLSVGLEPLRDLALRLTDRLFRARRKVQEAFSRSGRGLTGATTLEQLVRVLREGTQDLVAPWEIRLLVYQSEERVFTILGAQTSRGPRAFHAPEPRILHGSFITPEPLRRSEIAQQLQERPDDSYLREVRRIMEVSGCSVLVPLRAKGAFHGFLALTLPAGEPDANPLSNSLLVAVATQTALAVDNIRLYDEIRDADRLTTMGEMAARVAHEIKNPLGSIKAAAEFLQETTPNREFVRIIREETTRLHRLLEHFLDFARPPRCETQPENLNDVVEKSLTTIRGGLDLAPVRLDFQPQSPLPLVEVDAEQIRQVLFNLIKNAADALPKDESSVITVETTLDSTTPGHPTVELVISDNGPGIPAAMRGDLFTPFVTTKNHGTGLGLAIVKGIVDAHSAHIRFVPIETGGACFVIRFPAMVAETHDDRPGHPIMPPVSGEGVELERTENFGHPGRGVGVESPTSSPRVVEGSRTELDIRDEAALEGDTEEGHEPTREDARDTRAAALEAAGERVTT